MDLKLPKSTAIFSIIIGVFNIITWIMLIITGQVADIEEKLISFVFHWTSEFGMAVIMIIAGILILTRKPLHRQIYFFGSGMLLYAIGGATVFYIINFELAGVIMGSVITLLTIFFTLANGKFRNDLILFSLGLILYGSLNVMGNALVTMNTSIITYNAAIVVFALIASIAFIRKDNS
ncbi:MAG: hypothetical protein K9I94_14735 [Bacteroidales bacterium]|nr:hypothetical protein [Bacteroidales bacterium]